MTHSFLYLGVGVTPISAFSPFPPLEGHFYPEPEGQAGCERPHQTPGTCAPEIPNWKLLSWLLSEKALISH